MKRVAVCLLVLAPLVAGCMAPDGPQGMAPASVTMPPDDGPEPVDVVPATTEEVPAEEIRSPGNGTVPPDLFGNVTDGDGRPVIGANVTVQPLGLWNLTDDNGTFAFYVDHEGPLDVHAEKEGHQDVTAHVILAEGVAVHVAFDLFDLDALPGQVHVLEWRGFIPCMTVPAVVGDGRCPGMEAPIDTWTIGLDTFHDTRVMGVMIEAFWDDGAPAADMVMRVTARNNTWGQIMGADFGMAPLDVALAADETADMLARFTDLEVHLRPDANAGPGIILSRQLEVFASFFVNQPPGPGYTIQDA